ncbi:MAG: ABC transporter substrate-binding protein [Alphaproteobacteria bacterium]|nr:ABC transporter substrate-binding protein [Alphaproteobacteria bacterium]
MNIRIGVLLAAAIAAFGPAAGQAATPKKGGVLKFAVSAEPPNYDCHANSSFAFIHPVRPHYSTLLQFDAAKYPKVVGDLAASWTVSSDQKTYTFKLKPNVKFHDGSVLSSADVKASYERIVNPPQGVVSLRKAAYADIVAIETPDPLTVVFKLKEAVAGMLSQFASPWDCIYSAAKLKQDPKFPEKNIMGTGPFKFVEHVAGSHWVGERFKDYHESGKPYLDGFRAIFIRGAAMVNAVQAGEVMTEFRGFSPAERDKLTSALGDKVVVQESPWVCSLVVTFNTEKKPFDDARVRRALSMAVDRWQGSMALSKIALVRDVGGVLRPGYSLAAKESELAAYPGYDRDIKKSREEAKKLLKDAGVSSLKFKFTNRNVPMPYTSVGVYLIDQWRQIGVTVEHEQLETKLYQAALSSGNYEAGLDFNCDYMDDPNQQLLKYISAKRSSINYGRYNDEKLDELYDKQSRATDEKERYRLLREFEKRVFDQAYTYPTIWWHRIIVHWKQMKDWHVTPSHYLGQDLAGVWLDQ